MLRTNFKKIIPPTVLVAAVALFVYISQPQTIEEAALNNSTQAQESQANNDGVNLNSNSISSQDSAFRLSVPDIRVDTVGSDAVSLSELAQDKPTIVGFWASWCHNCQRNLPAQQMLYEKYKDDVNVLEVNLSESRSVVDNYVKDKGFTYLIGYDENGINGRQYNIRYTNTHLLIGSDGSLVDSFSGDVNESHFKQLISHDQSL